MFNFIRNYLNKRSLAKLVYNYTRQIHKRENHPLDDNTRMLTIEYVDGSGITLIYDSNTCVLLQEIYIPRREYDIGYELFDIV